MKSIKKQSGLTLIEMLIVLAIIALLASLATPNYFRFRARQRVRGAIRTVIEMKKALNDMSAECKGMPVRGDVTDENNFLQMIDKQECNAGVGANDSYMYIWKSNTGTAKKPCVGTSMGKQLGVESTGGVNAFCQPACVYGSSGCGASIGMMSYELFTEVPGDPCTPNYPSFGGGSPGWNYNLLTGAPTEKPVGVLCAISAGYRTPVKIIINTGGYYNGTAVREGSGVYDINGSILPNQCPCGPWCENMATGEKGCCTSCWDEPGIGYRY